METMKKVGILAGAAILLLAHISLVLADENRWSTGGPYDATVTSIDIHPFDNQRIYIGSVSNGIFQTTNGGADWFVMEDDTLSPNIKGIRVHPFGPDTIFAATGHGPFKSTDAGQTWFRLPLPYPLNWYDALEVNRVDPPTVFFGTWGDAWRSTDGGQTWLTIDLGVNTDVVVEIKADPHNPNTIYLTNGSTIPGRSIFKSTDAGVTWENIHGNIDSTLHIYGREIDVSPLDPRIVYFARYNNSGTEDKCLYKSADGGESWVDISPQGIEQPWLLDVAASPFEINTVFICAEYSGVLRSTDGGSSWEEINEGLISSRTKSIVIDPVTGFVYLGLFFDGIYRSTDNGDTWEKISHNVSSAYCTDIAINRRNPDTLYTATKNGPYMSTTGAASWEYIDLGHPNPTFIPAGVQVDPHDPSYIYLSCYSLYGLPRDGGFYRSTDGGSTWEFFTNGLPPQKGMHRIAVADYGGGVRRLFMGSGDSAGLFYSDDLGETWSLCQGGLPPDLDCYALEVSSVDPNILFASNEYPYLLYKSTSGGENWQSLGNLPYGDLVTEIACDPVDIDIVYIAVGWGRGLYKSVDGGQSWIDIDNDLPRPEYPYSFGVSGIAINPFDHDNIYVYSAWLGEFVSYDGGESWEDFNEGLRIRGGPSVTLIDPTDPRRLFLAMYGNSVWEYTITGGGGECVYIPGDCDHNGTALELADVIAMIGVYRGTVEPYYTCDCPPHGDNFAAEADPNGNCVTLELADVVTEIGAYRGTAEASGCPDCPGSLRLMPEADSDLMAVPSLSTKVKSKAGSITR